MTLLKTMPTSAWVTLIALLAAFVVIAMIRKFFDASASRLLDRIRGAKAQANADALDSYPYARNDELLTSGEAIFFQAASHDSNWALCCAEQGAPCRLDHVQAGTAHWQRHFNRISAKHVDFVLLDMQSLRPLLAIELDDRSHEAQQRKDRDELVNRALGSARLPILRVKAARAYSGPVLAKQLEQALAPTST